MNEGEEQANPCKMIGVPPLADVLAHIQDLKDKLSRSVAEHMIDAGRRFNAIPTTGLVKTTDSLPEQIEFTVACLKFLKLPKATQFRAICEGWTYSQILREIHN